MKSIEKIILRVFLVGKQAPVSARAATHAKATTDLSQYLGWFCR